MNEKEIRIIKTGKLEIRVSADGKKKLAGYSALFNSLSEDMGFREKIAPGAFSKVLNQDVRGLINHDPMYIIGRTASGTLRLTQDERGLFMECDIPDTSYGRDLVLSVERGDISQQSFSFCCARDQWEMRDGQQIRTLLEISDLFDVGPVTFPAYADTSIAKRSLEKFNEVSKEAIKKSLRMRELQLKIEKEK